MQPADHMQIVSRGVTTASKRPKWGKRKLIIFVLWGSGLTAAIMRHAPLP